MRLCFALLLLSLPAWGASGKYLTWIDQHGRLHNTFVGSEFSAQQEQARQQVEDQDRLRLSGDGGAGGLYPVQSGTESKRRYFTWVDQTGRLQSSFYANQVGQGGNPRDYVLPSGERASDYMDADVLEGRGFVRSENGNPYYTWVDDQGRTHNSPISVEERAAMFAKPSTVSKIEFNEGREVNLSGKAQQLPGLDGAPNEAMRRLLGDSAQAQGIMREMQQRCCLQLTDDDFIELSVEEPRYEEMNSFSPSLALPTGKTSYAAFRLPRSQRTYGLRVRSFANKTVVYPSLLFLNEGKVPTRMVSDAVYQLHPETWYRYAFLEGTVAIRPERGERYVLLITTSEDLAQATLDNQPFKRPLQELTVDEDGLQQHAHVQEGAFELAIVR